MNGTTWDEMVAALKESQQRYGEQRARTTEARDRAERMTAERDALQAKYGPLRSWADGAATDIEGLITERDALQARIDEAVKALQPPNAPVLRAELALQILASPSTPPPAEPDVLEWETTDDGWQHATGYRGPRFYLSRCTNGRTEWVDVELHVKANSENAAKSLAESLQRVLDAAPTKGEK